MSKSIEKKIASTFLTRMCLFLLQGLLSILIARSLGPENQGIYSLLLLIPMGLAIFTSMGLPVANTYFSAKSSENEKCLFLLSWAVPIFFGLVCFLLTGVFEESIATRLFHSNDAHLLFLLRFIPVALIFLHFSNNYGGLVLGQKKLLLYNLNSISQPLFTLIMVLCCFPIGLSLTTVVSARIIGIVVSGLLAMSIACRGISRRSAHSFSKIFLKNVFKYGWRSNFGEIASFLNYRIDMFLIGCFWNPAVVGYYTVAVLIAETIWFLPSSVQTVLFPEISSMGKDEGIPLVVKAFQLTAFISAFCIGILFLFDDLAIRVLFGAKYLPSVEALRFLYPAILAMCAGKILATFAMSSGRTDVTMRVAILSSAANFSCNLFLIPRFGIMGAAISSSISYSLVTVVMALWFVKTSGVKALELVMPSRANMRRILGLLSTGRVY